MHSRRSLKFVIRDKFSSKSFDELHVWKTQNYQKLFLMKLHFQEGGNGRRDRVASRGLASMDVFFLNQIF